MSLALASMIRTRIPYLKLLSRVRIPKTDVLNFLYLKRLSEVEVPAHNLRYRIFFFVKIIKTKWISAGFNKQMFLIGLFV